VKLDERNQELEAGAAAITEATGAEDLPAAAAALTEGTLPGRVVLAEADHKRLTAAEAELRTLKEGITLTQAEHQALKEGAEDGRQARTQLSEMRADQAIANATDREHRMLNDEARKIARKALVANYDEGLNLLKSYPVMPKELREPSGADGDAPTGAATVQAFIDEQLAAGKQLRDATSEARKKFSAAEFNAWKYRPAA